MLLSTAWSACASVDGRTFPTCDCGVCFSADHDRKRDHDAFAGLHVLEDRRRRNEQIGSTKRNEGMRGERVNGANIVERSSSPKRRKLPPRRLWDKL